MPSPLRPRPVASQGRLVTNGNDSAAQRTPRSARAIPGVASAGGVSPRNSMGRKSSTTLSLPVRGFQTVVGGLRTPTNGSTRGQGSPIRMRSQGSLEVDSTPLASGDESVLVGIRVRPLLCHERGRKQIISLQDRQVHITDKQGKVQIFSFDAIMDSRDPKSQSYASQKAVYELIGRRMVQHAFEGQRSTLFAYGMTGSGKTTTIVGRPSSETDRGILPRLLADVFRRGEELQSKGETIKYYAQFLELHNENLRDLLSPTVAQPMARSNEDGPVATRCPKGVEVRVHPTVGVYVTGATEAVVESLEEMMRALEYGLAMKMVASTAMNRQSSRSHTIFRFHVERSVRDASTMLSNLYVVDLAGRENERTSQVDGQRLVELGFINRSLMWLSICIKNLADKQGQGVLGGSPTSTGSLRGMRTYADSTGGLDDTASRGSSSPKRRAPASSVSRFSFQSDADSTGGMEEAGSGECTSPTRRARASSMSQFSHFRNSKLTLLLANALSGNSRTAMIGTLGPTLEEYEESLSTLRFATNVRKIELKVRVSPASDKDELLRKLREEVQQLKEQLQLARGSEQIRALSEAAEATRALYEQQEMDWTAARMKSTISMAACEQALKTMSIIPGKRMHPLPHLANESDDPSLCGMLVFHVPSNGIVYTIGSSGDCDFHLLSDGACLPICCPRVCNLCNDGSGLWISAAEQNGARLHSSTASLHERPGDAKERGVMRVNGVPFFNKVHLRHRDLVTLGPYNFRVATVPEVTEEQEEERFSAVSRTEDEEVGVKMEDVAAAIGPDASADPARMEAAQKVCAQIQKLSCAKDVSEFCSSAAYAQRLAQEANSITNALHPNSNLRFEVLMYAPTLAEAPAGIFTRLVQLPGAAEGGDDRGRTLYIWSLEKLQARLLLMKDAYEAWMTDPDAYVQDPLVDPWAEYGPAEIAELRDDHHASLTAVLQSLSYTQAELQKAQAELRGTRRMAKSQMDEIAAALRESRAQCEKLQEDNASLVLDLGRARESLELSSVGQEPNWLQDGAASSTPSEVHCSSNARFPWSPAARVQRSAAPSYPSSHHASPNSPVGFSEQAAFDVDEETSEGLEQAVLLMKANRLRTIRRSLHSMTAHRIMQ